MKLVGHARGPARVAFSVGGGRTRGPLPRGREGGHQFHPAPGGTGTIGYQTTHQGHLQGQAELDADQIVVETSGSASRCEAR